MAWHTPPLPPEVSAFMPRHPGRVERVGRVSGKGWPSLAGSVPCPYHLKDGTTTRKGRGRGRGGQDGRTSRRCPVAAVRWRCGGEVWRWHRPEPDGVAFLPSPCAMLRAGEAASGWRWCGRCRHQTEQKRGEELAKIAAASFSLVPSLPVSFALPYLTT